jgi:DNA-binding transcriptional LysR family regulator
MIDQKNQTKIHFLNSIEELMAFVAVVELNSFSEAAEKLSITQPALSRRIAKIENEVNQKLLIRGKKNIQPTPTGRRFYEIAQRLLIEIEHSARELKTINDVGSGRVCLSINMTWASLIAASIASDFRAEFPGYNLSIYESGSAFAVERVRNGSVEVGVTHKPKGLFGLEFEPLTVEEFVVACHSDHPLAKLKTVPPSALREHIWMRINQDSVFVSPSHIEFEYDENFPTTLVTANHFFTILRLVEQKVGVALIPRMAINQHRSEKIVLRPLTETVVRRTVGLLTKKGRDLSPAAMRLAEIIRSQVQRVQIQ